MNKREFNRYSMYGDVGSVLTEHAAIVATLPAMVEAQTRFAGVLHEIERTTTSHMRVAKGKAASKNMARASLAAGVLQDAATLSAFGHKNDDVELVEKCKVNHSDMLRMRDVELVNIATAVIDLLTTHLPELADYDVTQARIDELKRRLATYRSALEGKGSGSATKSGARKTLNTLLKQANDILEGELDKLAGQFEDSEAEFFAAYQSARGIKDLGIRHRKNGAHESAAAASAGESSTTTKAA